MSAASAFRGGARAVRAGFRTRFRTRARRAAEERKKGASRIVGLVLISLSVVFIIYIGSFGGGFYLWKMDALDLLRPALSVLYLGVLTALVLSSLGHAANAFFSSRDLWFWNTGPAPAWARFVDRLSETALAAAPATLGLGTVACVGLLRGAHLSTFGVLRGVLTLFLVATLPVAVGVTLAHIGGSLLPAGRLRRVTLLLVAVGVAVGLAVFRSARLEQLASEEGARRFLDQQRDLTFVGPYWLPSNVASDFALTGAIDAGFVLAVCSAGFLLLAYLAHRAFYIRARDLADDESPTGLKRGGAAERTLRFFVRLAPQQTRSLLEKDLLAFVRDPSQWSQLVLLSGIAVIYVINAQALVKGFEPFPWAKDIIISGMHVGLTTFIAAGLAARFAFPQMGLEGPAVWMLEGSPLTPELAVRAKLLAALPVCCGFPSAVAVLGGLVIGLPPVIFLTTTALVVVVSGALAAYGVGRGSVAPQFDAVSVSELAMGPGALSTMAIAVALCGLSFVVTLFSSGFARYGPEGIGGVVAVALTALPAAAALLVARRALKRGAEAFYRRREEGSAGTGAFTPGVSPAG